MVPDDPTRIHDEIPTGVHQTLSNDPERMIGRTLKGAYRLDGKIGEGGMGIVFRATQLNLGRPVAVKMIHVGSRIPATGVDRFFREARLLSQFHHPNIVNIIDFGTEPGPVHFMVMEFLDGESLDHFVKNRQRLAPELVLDLMEQLCSGMTAAHNAGIIHRDLKPSNLFVSSLSGSTRPNVKILDFGLGKALTNDQENKSPGLTREGVMMGTCGFSAPEQLHGGSANERADIYGLGALLYYMIASRPPYRDEGFRATLVKQLTNPPDPLEPDTAWPDLPAVEAIIHKAMHIRPAERYATPAELFAELKAVLRPGETVSEGRAPSRILPSPPPTAPIPPTVLVAPVKSRPWLIYAASALLLVLLGLGLWRVLPKGMSEKPDPSGTVVEIKEDLTFGLSAPLTGPTKELGRGMRLGIEVRFEAQNAQGRIAGRKLRLISRDDGYEPDRCRENMRLLLDEDKVFGFIGNVGTPTAEAALPIVREQKRLFFAPLTGARLLRTNPPNRYVFNYRASYADETAAIVRYLLNQRGLKPDQIAVFAQNDAYGDDGVEGVARAQGRKRDEILRLGYDRNKNDVTAAFDKLVSSPDIKAVVMVATYEPAARFIEKIRKAGLKTICTNVSFVGSDTLAEKLRALGCAEGVIVTQVVPPLELESTGVARFRADMAKYGRGDAPGFVALEGYLAASILIEGLKKVEGEMTTENLIDALESIRNLDLGTGTLIEFGPSNHQGSRKVWATVLNSQGKYRDLDLD